MRDLLPKAGDGIFSGACLAIAGSNGPTTQIPLDLLTGIAMSQTDPENKSGYESVNLLAVCVCVAAIPIFWIGAANEAAWPAAVAVCGLSFMGVGITF